MHDQILAKLVRPQLYFVISICVTDLADWLGAQIIIFWLTGSHHITNAALNKLSNAHEIMKLWHLVAQLWLTS